MKHFWLNKKDNNSLIIFFNGWGMDQKAVSFLQCAANDIIMFYDYRNLETESFDFGRYQKKSLVTWSMGTFISTLFYNMLNGISNKIAINGTLCPVDDKYGIAESVYDLTVKNFNQSSCKKFTRRMFNGNDTFDIFSRNPEELKQELISIKNFKAMQFLDFNTAFISDFDKIIPTKNQYNFWQMRSTTKIKQIKQGHYPFFNFKNWDEIIND